MRYKTVAAVLVVAVVLVTLTGCTRVDLREADGVMQESVRLKGADSAEVDLRMGPGNLTISGGGRGLMEGEFRYSDSSMEPEIDYRVDGDVGELDIRQGSTLSGPFAWFGTWDGAYRNEWNLALGEEVPTDLRLELGAGNTELNIGNTMVTELNIETGAGNLDVDVTGSDTLEEFRLNAGAGDMTVVLASGRALRQLDVEAGAGNIRVDLSGDDWEEDIDAKIEAGVGDLTVILPSDVSVRVNVDTGVGEVKADDFVIDDGAYVNRAFGEGGPRIELDIDHGIGNVILRTD